MMRAIGISLLTFLAATFLFAPVVQAQEIRIAAWNLEHLDDTEEAGCVGRTSDDYAGLVEQAAALDADIVAFQEVENEFAAARVFPAEIWDVVVSMRPPPKNQRKCWRKEATLGHLATGFAIRKGLKWSRNEDLRALDGGSPTQRWGTDITIADVGHELRLLSVHLRSGCWGAAQDADSDRADTCATLRTQMLQLNAWADARRREGAAFVILGDFNRRLALPDDWAWRLLSPPNEPLLLLTEGEATSCDPRFSAYIDHLVAGGGAETMVVANSFREAPRFGQHPDHCAVSAEFTLGQ